MRRYALCLALILLTLTSPASGDEHSKALLDAMVARLASHASYEMSFISTLPGEFENLTGRIVVSGDRYYMSTGDVEIFYDGKTRWVYTRSLSEVVCDVPRTDRATLLDNPARFARIYDEDFSHRYLGAATVGGRKAERIELTPLAAGDGYETMVLTLDAQTRLPLAVTYGTTPPIEITLPKFTPDVPAPDGLFRFDPRSHKGVEIIDFR